MSYSAGSVAFDVEVDAGLSAEVEAALSLGCASVRTQGEAGAFLLRAVCPCGEVREDVVLCAQHVGDWVLNFHEIAAAGIGWCGGEFPTASFTYSIVSLDM